MIDIDILSGQYEKQYEVFLKRDSQTLFYHSNRFRHFLGKLLKADDHYFLAIKGGEIVGALPAFLVTGPLGNTLNSLLFFGSNGGILEFEGNTHVQLRLLEAFQHYARERHCVSSTIITSPFQSGPQIYASFFQGVSPAESRIGQVTELPSGQDGLEERLMESFHPFTRRMIRKALKHNILVGEAYDEETHRFLTRVHQDNMKQKGGKSKPLSFFRLFPAFFDAGVDYKIWTARLNGKMVAALLLFYFNKTVEYYIPAILPEYRSLQPQSLIICRAMLDASLRGYNYWNWGGTWPTQERLYRFKKRWNTQNRPYFYYNQIYDNRILQYSKEDHLHAFPYAYVVPFARLAADQSFQGQ